MSIPDMLREWADLLEESRPHPNFINLQEWRPIYGSRVLTAVLTPEGGLTVIAGVEVAPSDEPRPANLPGNVIALASVVMNSAGSVVRLENRKDKKRKKPEWKR